MAIIVDTGPLVAYAISNEKDNERVRVILEDPGNEFIVPVTVLPEVCYLIERQLGARAEAQFISSLAKGELLVEPLTAADITRSAELVIQYADNPIGFVDASLVAIAERLNITTILTLDRRHFGSVRPRHTQAFDLLP